MARYQGVRLQGWIEQRLEGWLGLVINREKTRTVKLQQEGQALDFLGYRFRFEQDLQGRPKRYLNLFPSDKAMEKEREKIRELTGLGQCHKPAKQLIVDLNKHLVGWKNYYKIGYCRREFRKMNHFIFRRVIKHLDRRSQRGYRNHKTSWYEFVLKLGLKPL